MIVTGKAFVEIYSTEEMREIYQWLFPECFYQTDPKTEGQFPKYFLKALKANTKQRWLELKEKWTNRYTDFTGTTLGQRRAKGIYKPRPGGNKYNLRKQYVSISNV